MVQKISRYIIEIREVKDELIRMSNDDEERILYEIRAKTIRDKVSALYEERLKIAKSLLDIIEDDEVIASKCELDIEEVRELRNN